VTTTHGQLHIQDQGPLLSEYIETPLVSISNNQRKPIPHANWLATIYHGLPKFLYTFRDQPDDYLAFLGRLSPEKRVDRAIEIARQAGVNLKIAARVYPVEVPYFKENIEPLLRNARSWVEFIGEVGGEEKDDFLGNARALLFPIDWAEPFGLVMIEAMACGTPVIAWRKGSVPEVVTEGVTGFVVETIAEAARAVERVSMLNRHAIRQEFEKRFDAANMVLKYVELYRRLEHSSSVGR
jgi:glycosyltransferase involved in cell wall biosynthesis